MKVLQACSGEETHAVWTGTIKRLIHRYLEDRNKRRAFRRGSSENRIVARYEGRRWCDATERELIGDITNRHGSHLTLL
jgi:glutathione S-transferase